MGSDDRLNMYLLDTHIWVWLLSGRPNLRTSVLTLIKEASETDALFLSPISMWEVALKNSRGNLTLTLPIREWLARASTLPGLSLAPITPAIAASSAEFPAEFHGDPADRIIAATARNEGFTLITHDKRLLDLSKRGFFRAVAS